MFGTSGLGIVAIIGSIGVIATLWRHITGLISGISNFVIGNVVIDDNVASAIYYYSNNNLSQIKLRHKTFFGGYAFMKKEQKRGLVGFDYLFHKTVIYRKGFRFLLIKPGHWLYDSINNTYIRSTTVLLPRFFWSQDAFIKRAIDYYNDRSTHGITRRFFISRIVGTEGSSSSVNLKPDNTTSAYTSTGIAGYLSDAACGKSIVLSHELSDVQIDSEELNSPFDIFAYDDAVMDAVNRVRKWKLERSWYSEKKIPWRRGWLLSGKPGSGKSLLLRCLAEDLDFPIFIFDMASLSNQEFYTEWAKIDEHTPCMVVFEDLDGVFEGRKNITGKKNPISFDSLLNCISGIQYNDGIFVGITTNHPDKIDESLKNRPGRVDEELVLGDMNEKCRTKFARFMFPGEDISVFVEHGSGMTAAQFSEYCVQVALGRKYT